MGFLSASSTIVRFHAPPPARINRQEMRDAVERHVFRATEDAGLPREERFGWVAIHDPMVVSLDETDLFFQDQLLIGFRYDKRSVPAKLAWMERRIAERERREQDGVERLSLSIRREIRDDVTDRLMQKALPVPRLFECAWNLKTGVLLFTTRTGTVQEAFTTTFRETFGITPTPLIPWFVAERIGLPARTVDSFRKQAPAEIAAGLSAGEEEVE